MIFLNQEWSTGMLESFPSSFFFLKFLFFLTLTTIPLQSVRDMFLDFVLGFSFFIQTGFGVLGNFFLLCHCTFTFLTGSKRKPVNSIFFHLALANSIVLISKGVPQAIFGWGLKFTVDHTGCRLIAFFHRVARSLSVSITCLLSDFQTITIGSFSYSIWLEFRTCVSKYIFLICLFFWILHISINTFMLMNTQNFMENNSNTKIWNMGFCSDFAPASFNVSLVMLLHSIYDFLCVGFMIVVSGYLIFLLQRHHQQVQHIHASSLLSRKFPEIKATYTILVLVSTYVSFYSINSILSFYHIRFDKYYQWLMPTSTLLAACYSAISPFVLIISDSQILYFFQSLWQKTPSLSLA